MGNLFEELKRRNVFRVGIAYLVIGWLMIEVVDTIAPRMAMPEWVPGLVIILVLVGLPITLFLAWAFEMTPEGVKKTEDVDADASITPSTGQKLNRFIIGALVAGLVYFAWESRFATEDVVEPTEVASAEPTTEADAAPVEERVTIAVLPFADLSAAGDQEYFGDGIAEEIINRLVSLEGLKVTSRTSAFSFKGSNKSMPDIARELGAKYVLEGSVRSAGNQLRITAQLIEVASDSHLWSQTYDRQMDDIFAVQDDISASIARTLEVRLVGGVTTERPTNNLEAYRLYLQGHHLFLQRGIDNLLAAIGRFEEAVALDPAFAEAWADLAASTALLPNYDNEYDGESIRVTAGKAADRALALDPQLAQGWAAKGFISLNSFKWAEGHKALERAVELNPNNETAWVWLGLSYIYAGFLADAEKVLERAVEIAPQSGINNGVLGRTLLMQGKLEAGRKAIEEAIALGWDPAHTAMAVLAAMEGDSKRTAEEAGIFISSFAEFHDDKLSVYAEAFVDPTRREAALPLLHADIEQGHNFQSTWGSLLLNDGESFVYALETLSNAPLWMSLMLWHPVFRPMLKQQAVKDYLVRIGLVDYWREAGWPEFCRPVGANDFECE